MQNYLLAVPSVATPNSCCSAQKEEDDGKGIATSRSPLGWMTDESSTTMMHTPSACSPLPLTDASSGTNNTFLLTPSLCSTQPSPSLITPPSQHSQLRLHTLHQHFIHPHHVPDSLLPSGEAWSDPNTQTTPRQTPPMPSHWFIPEGNCSFSGDLDGATSFLTEHVTRERVTTAESPPWEALEGHSTNGKGKGNGCVPEARKNDKGEEKEEKLSGGGEPMLMHHSVSSSQTGYRSNQDGYGVSLRAGDQIQSGPSPLATSEHSNTLETNPNVLNPGQTVKGDAMDCHPKKEEEHDESDINHPDLVHPMDQGGDALHSETNCHTNNSDNDIGHYLELRKHMYSPPHFTGTLNEDVLFDLTSHGPYATPAGNRYRQYSSPPLSPKGINASDSGTRQVGSSTRSPMQLRGIASSSTTSSCTLDGVSRAHLLQLSCRSSGVGNTGIAVTNTSNNNSSPPRNSNNVNNHPSLEPVDSGSSYGCNNLTFPLMGNTAANRLFVQTMEEARGASEGDGGRLTEVSTPTDVSPVAGNNLHLSSNNTNTDTNSNNHSSQDHREGRVSTRGSCFPSNTVLNPSLGSPAPPPIKVWDDAQLPPTPPAVRGRGGHPNFYVSTTNDHQPSSIQSSQCVTPPATSTATTMKTSMPLEPQGEYALPCSTATNSIKDYSASSTEKSPTIQHQECGGFHVVEPGQEEEEEEGQASVVVGQLHQRSPSSATSTVTMVATPSTATFNVTAPSSSSTPLTLAMVREEGSPKPSTSNHPSQPPPPPLAGASLFTSSRLSYLGSGREDPLMTPSSRKAGRRSPSASPIGSPTLADDPSQEAHSPRSPRSKGLYLQHTTLPAGGSSRSSSAASSLRNDSGSPRQNNNNCTNLNFGNGCVVGTIIHPRSTSRGSQELGKNSAHGGASVVHRVPGSGSSSDVTSLLRIQVSNSGFPLSAAVGLENSFTSGVDGAILRSSGVSSPHRRLSPCRLSSLHHQNTPTTPTTFVTVSSSNPSMNINNNLMNSANTNNTNTNMANTNSIRFNNNSNHGGAQFQNVLRLSLTDEEMQSLLPVGATPPSLVAAASSIASLQPAPVLTPALSVSFNPANALDTSAATAVDLVTQEHHHGTVESKPHEVPIAGGSLRDRFPAVNEPVTSISNTEAAAQPGPPLPPPPHPHPQSQSRPSIRTMPLTNTSVLADCSSTGSGVVDGLVKELPTSAGEDANGATDRQSMGRRPAYGPGVSSFSSRFGQNAMTVGGGSATTIRRGASAGNSSPRYNAVSIQSSSGGFSLNHMPTRESGDMVFEGVMGTNAQSGGASMPNDVVTDAQPVSDEGTGILITARDGAEGARPHTSAASTSLHTGASSTALPRRRRSSLRARPLSGMNNANTDGNNPCPATPLLPWSGGANDTSRTASLGHPQETESAVESSSLLPPGGKSVMVSWSDHHSSPTVPNDPTHEADNREHHLAGTVTSGGPTVTFTFAEPNRTTNGNNAIEMNDDAQGELKKGNNNTSFNCNLSVESTLRRNSGDLMTVRSLKSGGFAAGSNSAFFSGVAPTNSTSPPLMSLFQPPLPPPPPTLSKNDGGGSVSHNLVNTSKNGIIQSSADSSCSTSTPTEGNSTKVSIIHLTDATGTHYTVRPGHRRRRQSRRSSHAPRFTINVPAREGKSVVKLSTVEQGGGLSENGIVSQLREDGTREKISSTAKPSKNMNEHQPPTGANDTACGEPSTTSLLREERDEETPQLKEKAEPDSARAGEENHIIVENSNQLSTSALILRALRLGGGGAEAEGGGGALLHTPTSLLSEGGFHRLSMVTPTSLAMATVNYSTAADDDVESPEEGISLLEKNNNSKNDHDASIPERNPLGLVSVKASGTHESESADSMVSGLGAESFRSDVLPSFSFGGGRFVYEDSLGMNESGSRYMYSVVNYIPNNHNDNNNNTNVNNNRRSHFTATPPLPVGSSPTAALPNAPFATWGMQSASRTAGGAWQYLPSASIGSVASAAGLGGLFHNLQRQSENLGHLFYISDDDEVEECDDEEEEDEEIEEEYEEDERDGPAEVILPVGSDTEDVMALTEKEQAGSRVVGTTGLTLERMAADGTQDNEKTTRKKRRAKRIKHGRRKSKGDAFGPLGESFAPDALVNELGNRNSLSAFGAMMEPQRRDHYREQGVLNGSVASIAEISSKFYSVGPQNAVVNLPSASAVGNPRSRRRSGALRPISVMSSVPSFAISSPNTVNTACSFVWTPNQPLPSPPSHMTTLQRFMGYDMPSNSFGVPQNGAPEDRYGALNHRGYSVEDPGYDLEPMPDLPSPYPSQEGASGEHVSSQQPPNPTSGDSPISADPQSVTSTAAIVFISPYPLTGSSASVNFPTTKPINEAETNGSMEERHTVADIPLNARSKPEQTKEHGNETDGGGEEGKPATHRRLTSVSYRQRDEGLIKNTLQWARAEADRRGYRLAPGTQEQSTISWINNANVMTSYDSNLYGSMLSVSSFSAGNVGNIVFPHPVGENSVCTVTSDASRTHQSSEGALSEKAQALQPLPATSATPQTGLETSSSHLMQCNKTETMDTAIMRSDREPLIYSFISPDLQNYSDSSGGRGFFRFPSNADVERTPSRGQESSISCASPKAPVQRFSTAAGAFDSRATVFSTNKLNSFEEVAQTTTVSTNAGAGTTEETELKDPQHIAPSAADLPTSAGSGSQSVPMFLNILTGSDLSLLEIPVPLTSLAGSGMTGISFQLGSSGFSSSTIQHSGQVMSCSGLSNVFSKAKSSQVQEQKLSQQGLAVAGSGGFDTKSETSIGNQSPSVSPSRPTQPPLASVAVGSLSTDREADEMCAKEKGNTDCRPYQMEDERKDFENMVDENREFVAYKGCENDSATETSIDIHSPLDVSRNHDHNPVALMLPHTDFFNVSGMPTGGDLSARAESGTAGGSAGVSYQSISFSKGPGVVSTTMIQVPDSPRFQVHNNADLVNASMPIPVPHTSSSMVLSSSPRVEETAEGNVVPHSPLDSQLPSSPRNRSNRWLSSTSRTFRLPSPIDINTTTTTSNNNNTTMTKDYPTIPTSQDESLSSAANPHSSRPLPLSSSPPPQGSDSFRRKTSLFSQKGGGGCSGDASTISSPRPPPLPHSPPGMPSTSSPCRRLSLLSINSPTSPTAGTRVAAFTTTLTPEPQPTGGTANPEVALSKQNEKHRMKLLSSPLRRSISTDSAVREADLSSMLMTPTVRPRNPPPTPSNSPQTNLNRSNHHHINTTSTSSNNNNNNDHINSTTAANTSQQGVPPLHPPPSLNSSLPLLSLVPPTSGWHSPSNLSTAVLPAPASTPHAARPPTAAAALSSSSAACTGGADASTSCPSPIPQLLLHPLRTSANSNTNHRSNSSSGHLTPLTASTANGNLAAAPPTTNAGAPLPLPTPTSTSPIMNSRGRHQSRLGSISIGGELSVMAGSLLQDALPHPIECVGSTVDFPSSSFPLRQPSKSPSLGSQPHTQHSEESSVMDREEMDPVETPIKAKGSWRMRRNHVPPHSPHQPPHPYPPSLLHASHGVVGNQPTGFPSSSLVGDTIRSSQIETPSLCGGPPSVNQTALSSPVTAQMITGLPSRALGTGTSGTIISPFKGIAPEDGSRASATTLVTSPKLSKNAHHCSPHLQPVIRIPSSPDHVLRGSREEEEYCDVLELPPPLCMLPATSENPSEEQGVRGHANRWDTNHHNNVNDSTSTAMTSSFSTPLRFQLAATGLKREAFVRAETTPPQQESPLHPPPPPQEEVMVASTPPHVPHSPPHAPPLSPSHHHHYVLHKVMDATPRRPSMETEKP